MAIDGHLVHHSAPHRYEWPSELDLIAQLAGFSPQHRWADWERNPFTAESENLVAVFTKPG